MYNLNDNELESLLQTGPVAISISSNEWENYGGGLFGCKSGVNVDHAVVLVGYTPDYWIVKNQWGKGWGEDGYIKIKKSRFGDANCLIGTSAFILFEQWILGLISLMGILILI